MSLLRRSAVSSRAVTSILVRLVAVATLTASVSGGPAAGNEPGPSSRTEPDRVGVYQNGTWWIDHDLDEQLVSRRRFFLGFEGAQPFVGDWNGDGLDEAGVFANGFWFLDYDGNGKWDGGLVDKLFPFGWASATPVVGDWNGDGADDVGVYANGFWFLDYDGNRIWDGGVADRLFPFGWEGVTPLVADWDGDGRDQVGVYNLGFWFLDYDGDSLWDGGTKDKFFPWGWDGVELVVGDWNGDGRDQAGVYSNGFWFLDHNGDMSWDNGIEDRIITLGGDGAVPVVGDWNGSGTDKAGVAWNQSWFLDRNGSGVWEPNLDATLAPAPLDGQLPVVGRWSRPSDQPVRMLPFNGALEVHRGTAVLLAMPAPVNPSSVSAASVKVSCAGTSVSLTHSVSDDGMYVSVRPASGYFGSEALCEVRAAGLRTLSGDLLASFNGGFVTAAGFPHVERLYLRRSLTQDLPTGDPLRFRLTTIVDPTTVRPDSFQLENTASKEREPIACQVGPDLMSLVCSPSSPLDVGTSFRLHAVGVRALGDGSHLLDAPYFTVGFDPNDDQAPRLVAILPPDGAIDVVRPAPRIVFSEPVASRWPAPDIRVTRNGEPVEVVFEPTSDDPAALSVRFDDYRDRWEPDSDYTITVNEAYDRVDLPLTNGGVTSSFSTAPDGAPLVHFSASVSPRGYPVPLNPVLYVQFSKPVDPDTVTSETFRIDGPSGPVELALSLETPTSLRLSPSALLEPNSAYSLSIGPGVMDLTGGSFAEQVEFSTQAAVDDSAPMVTGVFPPDGSTGAPSNQPIRIGFTEGVIVPEVGGIRLETAAGELVSTSVGSTVTGVAQLYHTPLTLGASYRVVVDGAVDFAGQPAPRFQSTFQVASVASPPDQTGPSMLSSTPAVGATDVPLLPTVTIEFDEPIDPTSLRYAVLATSGVRPETDVTVLDGGTRVRIVPTEPLLPGRRYSMSLYNVTDWSGNRVRSGWYYFTTVEGAQDNQPPRLLSIMPPDGSTLEVVAGESVQLDLVFSEPIDQSTLRGHSFVVVDGRGGPAYPWSLGDGYRYRVNVSVPEEDAQSVFLIGAEVEDLYGNQLGSQIEHRLFLDVHPDASDQGYVRLHEVRPGHEERAVPPDTPVTLIVTGPVVADGLEQELLVSENGALIQGDISARAGGRIIEFRPSRPFLPGAFVQVFLRDTLKTAAGQTVPLGSLAYPHHFHVEGPGGPFEVLGTSPSGSSTGVPANVKPRVRLSAPALPASVNANTVTLSGINGAVAGTTRLLDGGETIEFRPAQNLAAGFYSFEISTSVLRTDGEPLRDRGYAGFWTEAAIDATAPSLTSFSPPDAAEQVPLNAQVCVGFSDTVAPWTIHKDDLQLAADGQPLPVASIWLSYNEHAACFVPTETLRGDTTYSAVFSGAQDESGNSSGPVSWTFRTGQDADTIAPNTTSLFFLNEDVPPSSPVAFHFDEPIDPVSFAGVDVRRGDIFGEPIAGTWDLADRGAAILFTPDQPFPVGTSFRAGRLHVRDLAGNIVERDFRFTTGFGADATPPTVQEADPPNGAANVSPFPEFVFTFSERVTPRSVNDSTFRMFDGAVELPVSVELLSNSYPRELEWRQVAVRCRCPLELARTYRIEVSGVVDLFGNSLAPAYSHSFTTRGSYDFQSPTLTLNLRSQGGVYRNVTAKIRANEPLDPSTVTADSVYFTGPGAEVLRGAVTLDQGDTVIRLTPQQPLPANSRIAVHVDRNVRDANGNTLSSPFGQEFETDERLVDETPPFVTSVTPPDGATNVPLNTVPIVVFSETFDSFAGGTPDWRLLGPGGVEVETGTLLEPGASYVIDVPAEGSDFAELPFSGAQFTFTTAAAATTDTTAPTVSSFSPQGDAVPVDAQFEVVFDEPAVLFAAYLREVGPYYVPALPVTLLPGTDSTRAVIMPNAPLRPSTTYSIFLSAGDFAGNTLDPDGPRTFNFTTADGTADTEPPRVLSVNPPDGATGLSAVEAVLEMSEPIDSSTLRDGVLLFHDGERWPVYFIYPEGGSSIRAVSSRSVRDAGVASVLVTPGLLDSGGNQAEPFISRFETVDPESDDPAGVLGVRPEDGAEGVFADFSFTLFFSHQIDPTTAEAATLVSENGVLIGGSIEVSSNNQALTFTPDEAYADGAEVRLFLDLEVLRRSSGAAYGNYDWTTRAVVDYPDFRLLSGTFLWDRPRNTEVLLRFSKRIDPATVNAQTVDLNGEQVEVFLEDDGRQLRVAPVELLPASSFFSLSLDSSLRSVDGESLASQNYVQFRTNDQIASVAPTATISPVDGQDEVGLNGIFVVRFDGPFEGASVNPSTLSWTDGTTVYRPSMVSLAQFASEGVRTAVIVPDAPLSPSTTYTVTLEGATDQAGNPVPIASSTFTTGSKPDLIPPQLVSWAPSYGSAPRNTAISLEFSEPVNPLTVTAEALIPYIEPPVEFTQMIDASGRKVTLLPDQTLEADTAFRVQLGSSIRDVSGNPFPYGTFFTVWIGSEIETTPPDLQIVVPQSGAADVALDAAIILGFDREIRPASLDPEQIQVTNGGSAIPVRLSVTGNGRFVEIRPVSLFDPLSSYSWTVDGVLDLAGNALPAPIQGTFTTGAAPLLTQPEIIRSTPADGATGIGVEARWVVEFDQPVNPSSIDVNFSPSVDERPTWELSSDATTLTIFRVAPFPPDTQVRLEIRWTGLSGSTTSAYLYATTGP